MTPLGSEELDALVFNNAATTKPFQHSGIKPCKTSIECCIGNRVNQSYLPNGINT